MTQSRVRFASFEDYLAYSDTTALEGRYELINGELIEVPPESEFNTWIADNLQFLLAIAQIVPRRLIKTHSCEVQVPVLRSGDPANRYPDLVVLRPEHLELTQRRLTITLDMPPPRLIVEVLSPGKTNRERDLIHKRAQYAATGVPEYWLVDPLTQTVNVLSLAEHAYEDKGTFKWQDPVKSVEFSDLNLTVAQILENQG
jgi:Uma2 family endonuclease